MDVSIRGLGKFDDLARAFRSAAGSTGLRMELGRELEKVGNSTGKNMHAAIPGALPRSGGLAALVADRTTFTVQASSGVTGVQVEIRANGPGSLAQINSDGSFSHPVFNTGVSVEQTAGVTRGFLDDVFARSNPDIQRGILEAVATIKNKIERSV